MCKKVTSSQVAMCKKVTASHGNVLKNCKFASKHVHFMIMGLQHQNRSWFRIQKYDTICPVSVFISGRLVPESCWPQPIMIAADWSNLASMGPNLYNQTIWSKNVGSQSTIGIDVCYWLPRIQLVKPSLLSRGNIAEICMLLMKLFKIPDPLSGDNQIYCFKWVFTKYKINSIICFCTSHIPVKRYSRLQYVPDLWWWECTC